MSVTYAANDAANIYSGFWASNSGLGYSTMTSALENARWDFSASGTLIEVQIAVAGSAAEYSTDDGATWADLAVGAIYTPEWVTVYSGSAATKHVSVRRKTSDGQVYVIMAAAIRVTGETTPATAPAGFGPAEAVLSSTKITREGRFESAGGIFPGWWGSSKASDTPITFYCKGPAIRVFLYAPSGKVKLTLDGVAQTTVNASTDNAERQLLLVKSGLDANTIYKCQLSPCERGHFWCEVVAAEMQASPPAARDNFAFYGDSTTLAVTENNDSSTGHAYKVCRILDKAPCNLGLGSSCVRNDINGIPAGVDRTADITDISPAPTKLYIVYGVNDRGQSPANALRDAYHTMLSSIRSGLPSVKIYCLGIFQTSDDASVTAARAEEVAAVTAFADGNTVYVPTIDWFDPAVDTVEGLHPKEVNGYIKIANRIVPLGADFSYTTSGTSGTVTVTLASGATFTGDQKVTVAASAGTVTATAAGGTIANNGTGTVDVTPVSGATSFTYVGSATATITYTTDQAGWTNPTTTSYSAGPTVPGAPVLAVDAVEPAESGIQVAPVAPASNGGSAVLVYEIWHDIASAGFVLIGSISAANLLGGFLDRYVLTGLSVDIKVRCRNAIGNSAFSATHTVTSQGPDVLPVTAGGAGLSLASGLSL